MGAEAWQVPEKDAWSHVAGLTIAQDLSQRRQQSAGHVPQFGLAKPHPGFLPMGPVLVTPDEVTDRDCLKLSCYQRRDGAVLRHRPAHRRRELTHLTADAGHQAVPRRRPLTGTPDGVGIGRAPPRRRITHSVPVRPDGTCPRHSPRAGVSELNPPEHFTRPGVRIIAGFAQATFEPPGAGISCFIKPTLLSSRMARPRPTTPKHRD